MNEVKKPWGYIYCRQNSVKKRMAELEAYCDVLRANTTDDNKPYIPKLFVHKHTKYVKKHTSVREVTEITSIGMIFLQGETKELQEFLLNSRIPNCHLAYSRITHKPISVPDSQMEPFMRLMTLEPNRVEYIDNRADSFKGKAPYVRVTSGVLKGLEGYIYRIHNSRCLILDIGDFTITIRRIMQEPLEKVEE